MLAQRLCMTKQPPSVQHIAKHSSAAKLAPSQVSIQNCGRWTRSNSCQNLPGLAQWLSMFWATVGVMTDWCPSAIKESAMEAIYLSLWKTVLHSNFVR